MGQMDRRAAPSWRESTWGKGTTQSKKNTKNKKNLTQHAPGALEPGFASILSPLYLDHLSCEKAMPQTPTAILLPSRHEGPCCPNFEPR